jgi:membrane protease YdiL (CAAX protease family)
MADGQNEPGPPWGGPELIAAYALSWIIPPLVLYALLGAGFFRWYYGAELVELALKGDRIALARMNLWAVCVALPLQLAGILGLLRATCQARPEDVGLTPRGAGWSALAGLGLSVVLLPAVFGLYALVKWLSALAGLLEEDHAFLKLAREGLNGTEWGLLVFAACVAAAVNEELIFRGMVQRWAERGQEEGWFVMLCALALAVYMRAEAISKAFADASMPAMVNATLPALCVVALAGVYALISRRPWGGIFAASVLFAFVHTAVWPTPIPLLVLALGLGWLASRWQNLAGPMLVHSLSNAVACVALLWEVQR